MAQGGLGERGEHGVLLSVAAALQYLHKEAGIMHGDVKGRNVLLGGRCDAQDQGCGGAARLVSDDALRAARDARVDGFGGPRGGVGTPASDVWALGCTALELLTGNRPWSKLGGASEVGELLLLVEFGGGAKARKGRGEVAEVIPSAPRSAASRVSAASGRAVEK